jgi:MYXO-CTERM domain-containing protein
VLELALAYNFVTPYTAFLAIPESEMGAERGTIEAQRERKRQIMANHQDAANIDKEKQEEAEKDSNGRPGLGTSVATRSPTVDPTTTVNRPPPPPSQRPSMDRNGADDEDEEIADKKSSKKRFASKSDVGEEDGEDIDARAPRAESMNEPINRTGATSDSRRGRGCAGCATNDHGSTALLGLLLGLIVLRRRRR